MGFLPPFPDSAGKLQAPPSWRCIDFVSDIHLHEGLPRTTEAFARYLHETPADAVLILGDLFEAWVGDDMRSQAYEAECVRFLADAGSRLWLGIMVGNRDFLAGTDLLNACGAHHLADPTVLDAFGRKHLLIHGDELCLADTQYLAFRAQVRNAQWQAHFLSAPLEARLAQARQMREASRAKQATGGYAESLWADVDEQAAAVWMAAAGVETLIHGHTHRPQSAPFGVAGGTRHVLSDWDFDHADQARGEVLRLDASGFRRLARM